MTILLVVAKCRDGVVVMIMIMIFIRWKEWVVD